MDEDNTPLDICPEFLESLGLVEQEVLDIIEKITKRLSYKFTFGSHEYEDICQVARVLALRGLHSYRVESGELENFLWVHVHNRLCNYKRKHFVRLDKPCLACPLKAYIKKGDLCKIYDDKQDCELYAKWFNRNEVKKNIINPVSMSVVLDTEESNMSQSNSPTDNLYAREIIELLDTNITPDVRPLWLQLKAGMKIHPEDLDRLRERIGNILEENGVKESW
jgi:DNA-directed RNA polymerase specialized sigma24 family protein